MQETAYVRGNLPVENLEPRLLLAAQLIESAGPEWVNVASSGFYSAVPTSESQAAATSDLRIDAIVDSLFEEESEYVRRDQVGQNNAAHREFVRSQQLPEGPFDAKPPISRGVEVAAQMKSLDAAAQGPRGPPAGEGSAPATTTSDGILVVLAPDVQHGDFIKAAFYNQAVQYLDLNWGVDPISQITQQLERLAPVSSLHLFTHGSPATIQLGGFDLDAVTLLVLKLILRRRAVVRRHVVATRLGGKGRLRVTLADHALDAFEHRANGHPRANRCPRPFPAFRSDAP